MLNSSIISEIVYLYQFFIVPLQEKWEILQKYQRYDRRKPLRIIVEEPPTYGTKGIETTIEFAIYCISIDYNRDGGKVMTHILLIGEM